VPLSALQRPTACGIEASPEECTRAQSRNTVTTMLVLVTVGCFMIGAHAPGMVKRLTDTSILSGKA
jgi:hypothetical protein